MAVQYQYPNVADLPKYLEEPQTLYLAEKMQLQFGTSKLEALQASVGFSQAEWAAIINVSLKTLQRYLKDGTPFEGLQAEHLLQLEKLMALGLSVFDSPKAFEAWLRRPKNILNKPLNFDALQSFWGSRLLFDELGRMAYGIYI